MRRTIVMFAVGLLAGACFADRAAAGEKAVTPFNGKDLSGWKLKGDVKRSQWQVGIARLDDKNPSELQLVPLASDSRGPMQLVNVKGRGIDIYTEEKWGDAVIEVELMVPKGSNSGIYVMGEYEVQVLDSYGREKVGAGDLGGLYGASAPKVNASKKPGEWQKFVIDFQAPRFEGGKKTSNAKFLRVVLNDQVIHENAEMKGPTPTGVTGREAPTGPLMFQGNHGPVAYRNIRIIPK
jgi:hypothetical protein